MSAVRERPTGAVKSSSPRISAARSAKATTASAAGRRVATCGPRIRSLLVDVAEIRDRSRCQLRVRGHRLPGDGSRRGRTVRAVSRACEAGPGAGLCGTARARRDQCPARAGARPAWACHRRAVVVAACGGGEHVFGADARAAPGGAAGRGAGGRRPQVVSMRRPLAALVAALVTLASGCGPGAKSPTPPGGVGTASTFIGVVSEDAFAAQGTERARILHLQALAGVRLLRQTFDWSLIERRPDQYRLGYLDDYVLDAAGAGMTVLPVLFNPPA